MVSTLYLDRPRGARRPSATSASATTSARLRAAGLEVRERVYAPFGDDPLLLHDVTIRNTHADARKRVSWFEYWDVNPYDQATDAQPRGSAAPGGRRAAGR